MERYSIKKGQKNFRPLECPWPVRKAKGWEVEFEFVPGGWSSLEEWEGDRDRSDWQKLKGLTSFFSANNKNSTLSVFRPASDPGTWQVNAYTNWPGSRRRVENESSLIIRDGERGRISCLFVETPRGEFARYEIEVGGEVKIIEHPYSADRWNREIGTYAGGANNSEGPHGGVAIKDQSIMIGFRVIK